MDGLLRSLVVDNFALYFNWIFPATTLLVGLISYRYRGEGRAPRRILRTADAHPGGHVLPGDGDRPGDAVYRARDDGGLVLHPGRIPWRSDQRSNEAALKYLLLGGFSSGFLAYGFSILYGISGSTKLRAIAQAVAAREPFDPILFLGIATITVGLMFKIAAAPFHMWAPDAYEGAPTSITAYLAVGSKAALASLSC